MKETLMLAYNFPRNFEFNIQFPRNFEVRL